MIELHSEGEGGIPLVFLHGWPDDPSIWDGLVARFVSERRCLRVQLPAFPGSAVDHGDDFPVLADQLEEALQQAVGDTRVIFVGHDWGAVLTYLFAVRHPERLARIVTLDIGGHMQPPLRWAWAFVGYQGFLITAEAVGRRAPGLGDRMARWMARTAGAPEPEKITARCGWPYRYAWRAVLNRRYRKSFVRNFEPRHPLLFLYGTRKPFHFHSERWEQTLEARDDCRIQPIDANHWLMLKRPDEVYASIAAFV